jgi:hypothetical protein
VGAEHAFVVPVFGHSPWLPQCLDSLQRQTLPSSILIATSTPTAGLVATAARYGIDVRLNPAAGGIAADWNFALAKQVPCSALTVGSRPLVPGSTKHFGNLVPVLVARNREQS